eukprot:CAMPEP_0196757842 /NCGR_PEP_ID=MMETSP1091-20130531/103870_1 /TAXON_ID=302021 /ORGANISM="Rhodomonas sp., Strain CCMP768" /LENGTH=458 /DNA_ID=CAMNT_0042106627 /DNA_START=209 /DNA_END=1585 /DNA_ORIENTATION=-
MASSKEAQAQNGEEQKKPEQTPTTPPVKLEGDELKDAIKKQVEYYFSRENLYQDAFLVGKMDAQHFVEVSVIADFKMVKQLTTDQALILDCVKDSTKVVVDLPNKKIKPVAVNARTTLILRNIPSAANEADVKALLADDKCPKVLALRSDVGDNWFAQFETEEATKEALNFAKNLKWEGKPIGCAIKSENLLKGLTPGSPPKGGAGGGGYYVPNYGNGAYSYGAYMGPDGQQYRHNRGGQRPGRGPAGVMGNGVPAGADDSNGRGRAKGKAKTRGSGRDGQLPNATSGKEQPQAPINLADFPKLEGAGKKETGYSKPFKAYGREEMLNIIKASEPGPVEALTNGADAPFLSERDTKLEKDKTSEEILASNKHHEGKDGQPDTPAAPAVVQQGGNAGEEKKNAEKAKEPNGSGKKEGEKAVEKSESKADAPINGGGSGPKKLSYAQMAYANGTKKEAAE